MARGRFLSRSISTNEQLALVSIEAALLFTWCVPHIDIDGYLTGNPSLIKANVVPLRDEITLRNLPHLLRELAEAVDHEGRPLVVWYEVGATKVLYFPGFSDQQGNLRRDREAASKIPHFGEHVRLLAGFTPATVPETLRLSAGPTPGVTPAESRSDSAAFAEKALQVQVEVQDQVQVEGEGEDRPPVQRAAKRARIPTEQEQALAAQLETDSDRVALTALVVKVPNPGAWLAEMSASLIGMGGHVAVTPAQLGEALRDYVANGATSQPGLKHFRSYLRRAAIPPAEPSSNGALTRGVNGYQQTSVSFAEVAKRMAAEKGESHQ